MSHPEGLAHDLLRMGLVTDRRQVLRMLAGASLLPLVGCGGTGNGSGGGGSGVCAQIPEETAGPYPGDGSNGVNALSMSGIVRSDISGSFGTASGVASGVPLTVELQLQEVAADCAASAGLALYLWHCDAEGRYSLYSSGVTAENYLRGVQASDDDGIVRFTTIFPGCYSGRWPHMHFEVFTNLDNATSHANKIATSQLALPEDVCAEVYAQSGYESSVRNLASISLSSDNVFSDDGASSQLAEVSGDVSSGLTAKLVVPVEA